MSIFYVGIGFGLGYACAKTSVIEKMMLSKDPPLEVTPTEIKIFGYTVVKK